MKERPILFSAPMVRAILAGTKTQTRRVVNLPADAKHVCYWAPPSGRSESGYADPGVNYWTPDPAGETDSNHLNPCPYGQPGDRLWVRETWQFYDWCSDGFPHIKYKADGKVIYHDTTLDDDWGDKLAGIWNDLSDPDNYAIDGRAADRCWRSSIHMPRWASRLTLEVTGVRVERVQDISEVDAKAEGIPLQPIDCIPGTEYRTACEYRWQRPDSVLPWSKNPWVWVVEFKRIET